MISYTNFLEYCAKEGKRVTENQSIEIKEYLSERSKYISEECLEIINELYETSLRKYIYRLVAHKLKFEYLSPIYYSNHWITTIMQQNKLVIDLLSENKSDVKKLKDLINSNPSNYEKEIYYKALTLELVKDNDLSLFPKSIPSDEYRFPKVIDPINNLNFIKYYCNKNKRYKLVEFAEKSFKRGKLI